MKLNENMFRMYDIRGVWEDDLTVESAELIGKAFGTYVRQKGIKDVLVGRDNRLSSRPIRDALIKGLTSTGCDVLDVGVLTTPAFYYSNVLYNYQAGMMITASHNPPQFNGFKVMVGPSTIYGDELKKLYYIAEKGEFEEGTGNVKYAYPINSYINMIKEKVKLGDRKLKVVVDCGNGTGSYFYPDVIYNLGCEVYPLYCESDPTFPNHFPDPVKEENLKDLIEEVKRVNADLGIAFDGDGDRIGVVDDKGNVIWGDMLMILYWREIMKKHPGADAIVEVKCSQALVEEIERLGGKPIFFKTGHSLIKAKMKELGAVFTGEMSGHMFFADEYYGFDDAAYAAARLLRILSNTDKSLSELLADVPKYPATPEIRLECDDEKKFDVVKGVTEYFKEKGYNIIDVDGARVLFDGGWGLVRASNTGPELIVRCEAKTEEKLEAIKKELSEALAKFSVEFK
ncbi:MAG: Phosphomannomutase [Caldanaerobacter subterraneus]|jgi:phosphomannomutase/phosphoglucomutase|uniref:Phosphomannomutase n=2 Tax=Thermoanaerobacter TaxID=1754 RepID=B0KAR8_THEP3|nr:MULTISPECIES: phosphoglucosamine mutase [Thermoanaerobacter]KUJ90126.1 MAG: phosphomannomutase [Thermoanaerobacter thermocopriae]KUK35654.1 MAG: Phosphomannomutase [Caldanaerobacter subterraneus]ABY93507.1 Phosphomannomutase [Thermoanaerobacter sp. X514]ABY95202.1 Phosphomannomutase [Thermoanaerobacter pseudethanolicus ATCC 33223]ADV80153.1 phosphoglucomutase/phosphomannomutase alpha/beta/alpha domain II [Thermoanaerobacter brockii subsp. finnii Ako-1]